MIQKKTLGISIGVLLILVSGLVVYAVTSRVLSWTPAELKPVSTAPGQSASYTLTLTNTGTLPITPSNQLRVIAEGDIAPFVTITQPTFPPSFKSGNTVTVKVTVTVATTTTLSVKKGDLVLERILPNGTVKEVWKTEALPVELTFSSFTLPPDPGEAGKATLAGIDSDGDGVRDDIQRYIALTYPDSAKTRAALTQTTKTLQKELLDANNKEAAIANLTASGNAIDCLYFIVGSSNVRAIFNELKARILNTRERSEASILFNQQLGGQGIGNPPIGERKSRCTFNPDIMEN